MDRLNLSALNLALLEVPTGAGARLKEKARLDAETPRQTLLRVAAQKAHAVAFKLEMFEVRLDRGNRVYADQVEELKAQYQDAVKAVARAAKEPNLSGAARASLDDARADLDATRNGMPDLERAVSYRAVPLAPEAQPVRPASPVPEANPEPEVAPRPPASPDAEAERMQQTNQQEEEDRKVAMQLAAEDSRVRRRTQYMTPNENFRGAARRGYDEQQPRPVQERDL
jgi:hypothetical protein